MNDRSSRISGIGWDPSTGRATLSTGCLELVIETKAGLNARSLRNARSGHVYADRDYSWQGGGFPQLQGGPEIADHRDGSRSIALKARLGSLIVEQTFTAPRDGTDAIVEEIGISNPGSGPLETAGFTCGFTLCVREGESWSAGAEGFRVCPVPYRRETNGKLQELPLREIAEHGTEFAGWAEPAHPTPVWGAEGWVWAGGDAALLIAKHNPDSMEWSLMEPLVRGSETVIRFGGAGQWKHGHPERSTRLGAGESCRFGPTLLQAVDGGWKQAYYAHRRWREGKGCAPSPDYDPPVHWNELYDNEYYHKMCAVGDTHFFKEKKGFTADYYERNRKLLEELYTLDMMKAEAAKARELGCEALYLDPGWEAGPSRQVWDERRLGSIESFVTMIRHEYGLRGVSFWCSLAGVPPTICDPSATPPEARVIREDGAPADLLVCVPSPAFLDTKERQLLELCRSGAALLMFDSNQYSGPCHDGSHGHRVPSTREEHAEALFELARRVKARYPRVLIEMHDPVTGPCGIHYTPTYFGYAPPRSFDCLWGHEFMWSSMTDLLERRAVSLYYYNLAYSIPLYLHISLKQENEHALLFWWYASTCRHLGMGGKPGPAAWEACTRAMRTYLSLKRFYTQGAFYGIDETVHAHTLADRRESVLNVFNLEEAPAEKRISFRPDEIGLPAGAVRIEGAGFRQDGDEVVLTLEIPGHGHHLLRVGMAPEK